MAPVAAANPGDCTSIGTYNDWATANVQQLTQKTRGIRAVMYAPYLIEECSPGLLAGGPSYWVALTGELGGGDDILQIGIIECDGWFEPACVNGTARVFWAYGGCNGYTPEAKLINMTVPPSGAELNVKRLSDGWYKLYVDGVEKAKIYKGDPGISCWADTGDVNAEVSCERWDANDMCGTSLDRVAGHGVWFQTAVGGSWHTDPFIGSSSCQESNAETQCYILDENSAQFWTAQ